MRNQQKGVDALMYRDLMSLARERAVSRIYLVSGDEDLREGVVAAQDLGVQVVLVGFPPTPRTGRSAALVREVDEVVVLGREFWEPHFSANVASAALASTEASEGRIQEVAGAFVRRWAAEATSAEVIGLLSEAPRIPKEMDGQLIIAAEREIGSLREYPDRTRALRKSFWGALRRHHRATRDGGTLATDGGPSEPLHIES